MTAPTSPDPNDEQRKQLCAQFTAKLLSFAERAEAFMKQDDIAEALVLAIAIYTRRRSSEAQAVAFIRGIADDLEASGTAPTVN